MCVHPSLEDRFLPSRTPWNNKYTTLWDGRTSYAASLITVNCDVLLGIATGSIDAWYNDW